MASVEITQQGASAPAVSEKPAHITVTASDGMVLTLREPDVLAPYRLVRLVGGEAAENRMYMAMVFPFLYLAAINGEEVYPPNSGRELEALIQRVGRAGAEALRSGVDQFTSTDEEADAAAVKK